MAEISFAIGIINDGSGNYTSYAIATPAVRASGGTRVTTEPWIENSTQTEAAQTITNATNATRIVVTVAAYGNVNGDTVVVEGVAGNTRASGGPSILPGVTTNTCELQDAVGTAPWTSGGKVRKIARTK